MTERPTGLRRKVAAGTLINGAFLVFTNGISLVRGFVVAAFLTTTEYGLWGVLGVILISALWLRGSGIGDRYIQQNEDDQELAFQRALTLDVVVAGFGLAAGAALVPVVAVLTGHPEVVAPGLVLLLLLPATAFQAPLWVFYRRFQYGRQRLLASIEPTVGLIVAVSLAVAGAGTWSLVLGTVIGAWAAALAAIIACPYKIAFTIDRQTIREYWRFSWPVVIGQGDAVVVGQALIFVGNASVGLAGLGIVALTSTIMQFTTRADQAVSQALYPAICRVRDRADLFLEAFQTSNRLSLMWGFPFGVGVALFSEDVLGALGDEWLPGAFLLSAVGASIALHQIGYNWASFYKATGDTGPLALASGIQSLAFLGIAAPLFYLEGLKGLGIGFLVAEAISFSLRWVLLERLLTGLRFVRHSLRAIVPTLPPLAMVLALRLVEGGERTTAIVAAEVLAYVLLTGVFTFVLERRLLRDVAQLMRPTRTEPMPAA